MIAESRSEAYRSYRTLAEAVANDALVILQGDYGGQIYFTCPAAKIKVSESDLKRLLSYLDAKSWQDAEGASICFEDHSRNAVVPGGMGGGLATDDVWLHPKLQKLGLEKTVRAFVSGLIDKL
jgi:hypothetical protein